MQQMIFLGGVIELERLSRSTYESQSKKPSAASMGRWQNTVYCTLQYCFSNVLNLNLQIVGVFMDLEDIDMDLQL